MKTFLLLLFVSGIVTAAGESKGNGSNGKEEERKGSMTTDAGKKGSIFDELKVEKPDFSKLPANKRDEAELKWVRENLGFEVPKPYIRFMERLEREAKKPAKDSKYIGSWGKEPERNPQLNLAGDGTFTWDYGHSKGTGLWLEHEEGLIWIGFARTEKDDGGKEFTWYITHYCCLKGDDTLVEDNIDYVQIYKRADPRRAAGLSVRLLPRRVADITREKAGFVIWQHAGSKPPGGTPTMETAQALLDYIKSLPREMQLNGIWVVITNPDACGDEEARSLDTLKEICTRERIPLFTCPVPDFPKGWKRKDK